MRLEEKTGASSCLDSAARPQSGWSRGTCELLPGSPSQADSCEDARIWEKKENKIKKGNIGFTGHSGLILNLKVSQLWALCAPSSTYDPSQSISLYCLSLLIQILFQCSFKKVRGRMEDTRVFSSVSDRLAKANDKPNPALPFPLLLVFFFSPVHIFFFLSTKKKNQNKTKKKNHILVTEYWSGWYRLSFREVWACLVS